MRDYKATVTEASKELTAKEKIMLKDTSNAESLDTLTQDAAFEGKKVLIDVDYYAIIEIHNSKSDNPDYNNIVIVGKDGRKYVTGSDSFMSTFIDIYNEMKDAGEEEITVECYRKESKNYKGKDFITCSII